MKHLVTVYLAITLTGCAIMYLEVSPSKSGLESPAHKG